MMVTPPFRYIRFDPKRHGRDERFRQLLEIFNQILVAAALPISMVAMPSASATIPGATSGRAPMATGKMSFPRFEPLLSFGREIFPKGINMLQCTTRRSLLGLSWLIRVPLFY